MLKPTKFVSYKTYSGNTQTVNKFITNGDCEFDGYNITNLKCVS